MSDESRAELVSLRDARERVIAQLSAAFADGTLEMEEFEHRVTLAHRTESHADLEALVRDFAEPEAPPAPPRIVVGVPLRVATALVPVRPEESAFSILGSVERRGGWVPPRFMRVLSVMGSVVLDYREATLAPGVSEVLVSAILGSVDIIVPPSLAVDMTGSAILGSFEHTQRSPVTPDPDRPVLRVHGLTFLGAVTISTQLPGESSLDAFMRGRRERKALREGAKAKLLTSGADGAGGKSR